MTADPVVATARLPLESYWFVVGGPDAGATSVNSFAALNVRCVRIPLSYCWLRFPFGSQADPALRTLKSAELKRAKRSTAESIFRARSVVL